MKYLFQDDVKNEIITINNKILIDKVSLELILHFKRLSNF